MKRRDFSSIVGAGLIGGALSFGSLAVHAQQPESTKRVGVLVGLPTDDAEGSARLAAFQQGLAGRGWSIGGDLVLDHRAAGRDPGAYRKYAEELVALRPDVLLAGGTP